MMKNFLFLVLLASLVSCGPSNEFDLDALVGKWQMVDGESVFTETWANEGRNHMKGEGAETKNGQVIFSEKLEIKKQDDILTYFAEVPDQNGGNSVAFSLKSQSPLTMRFENASHDFPQFISYEMKAANELEVKIGLLKDDSQTIAFHFTQED